jgi:hypothetical protein
MTTTALNTNPHENSELIHLEIRARYGLQQWEFRVEDPEVLTGLMWQGDPQSGLAKAIEVGSCMMRATGASLGIQSFRRELSQAVEGVGQEFSLLRSHMLDLVGENGPLTTNVNKAATEVALRLQQELQRQSDPGTPGTLSARIQAALQPLLDAVAASRRQIVDDVNSAAMRQTETVGKLVDGLRNLDPSTALGGAISRIEQKLDSITVNRAVAQERLRGTGKGTDYEQQVADTVFQIGLVHGDHVEYTANQTGAAMRKTARSKNGDCTATTCEGSRIAVEAMDRDRDKLTRKLVSPELDQAMANREAQAAIAVMPSADNGLMNGQPFAILGPNQFACILDREDHWVDPLKMAYLLARHAALASIAQAPEVDLALLQEVGEDLAHQLQTIGSLKTQVRNSARCHKEIESLLNDHEVALRAILTRLKGRGGSKPTNGKGVLAAPPSLGEP